MKKAEAIYFVGLTLFAFLLLLAVGDHIFFWDTIQLASKHAHWYYENNFQYFLLPDEIDSGHPPAFGMYLALIWKLFGKSLLVSHLAMLPFLSLLMFGLIKLGKHYGGEGVWWALPLLALADPVMLGQLTLVSPDLALMAFFLLGWYAILTSKQGLKVVAAVCLAVISTRGMMVVVLLFLFECWYNRPHSFRGLALRTSPYVPSGLIALAYLAYHYTIKGWIGYHDDSPWAPGFQPAEGWSLLKNAIVLAWRYADLGRIFVWLAAFGVLALSLRKDKSLLKDKRLKESTAMLLISVVLLSITFLLYKGLHGHRYLLPAFFVLTCTVFTLITKSHLHKRVKNIALGIILLGLATGNLWVYPDKISQGWDSTLAHWPYYDLRQSMLSAIEEEGIPLSAIGTAFPDIGPLKYKDLSDSMQGMKPKELDKDEYILYSNIMNDFTDAEIDELQQQWQVYHRLERNRITFILYKRSQ
jgi:hypothetical protein